MLSKKLIRWVFLFIAVGLFYPAHSQYFTTGNAPARVKWSKIQTTDFTLIFPSDYSGSGLHMAGFVAHNLPKIGASLTHHPRSFPIINHAFSGISNGYTIWAPRRVELYPRPPIFGLAEDYTDHLLVHELRHIVQMDKLNQGITKWAGYVLGDQAVAAVVGLHMPGWFSEGDAVLTETLLSKSGRGRSAIFSEPLRGFWLNGGGQDYDQAIYGSYREFIPNHYVTGYHMVAMGRMLGGPLLWSGALTQMARKPLQFANLSRYLKKEIRLDRKDLYFHSRTWFTNYWNNDQSVGINAPLLIHPNHCEDYQHDIKYYPLQNGGGLSLRKNLSEIPFFVEFDANGSAHHLIYPGFVDGNSFSFAQNRLVWAEHIRDRRWEHQSFSDVFVYSLESGKKTRLSKKERLYDPAIDPGGDKIACLEYLPGTGNQLMIMDAFSGVRLQEVPAPEGMVFQQPSWDEQSTRVLILANGRAGKQLFYYNSIIDSLSFLYDFGPREVFYPVYLSDEVYFVAPHGTRNAVYALNLEQNKLSLVSTDSLGINFLSVMDGNLYGSVYRANGYQSVRIATDSARVPIKSLAVLDEGVTPLIKRVENENEIEIGYSLAEFEIKPYRKALNLLKFHSWAPLSLNTTNYGLKPGLMLLSQNDLSSLSLSTGIEFDYNRQRLEYFVQSDFTGWFPKISFSGRTYKDQGELVVSPNDTINSQYWYSSLGTSVSIPLNFSSGRWMRGLTTSIDGLYSSYQGQHPELNQPFNRKYLSISLGLRPYVYSRMSHRDLYPKIGLVGNFSTTMIAADVIGVGHSYLVGSIQSYLPGFGKNHSTRFYAGGFIANEWPLPGQNPLMLPRGLYQNFSAYSISSKLDYAFPFAYPDLNLSSLVYVKRLKANLFVDAAKSMNPDHEFFFSTGFDLRSDFFLLRMGGAEFDAGLRTIYNPSDKDWSFEFLFDFSID